MPYSSPFFDIGRHAGGYFSRARRPAYPHCGRSAHPCGIDRKMARGTGYPKTSHYSNTQRTLIFGLSSSHAAATLAIILVGYRAGILDEYILNGTIILILLTCIVASVFTQRAARKIAISEENEPLSLSSMGDFTDEKILVPIANPSNIGYHVHLALLLQDKKSANPILLLGVVPNNDEAEKNIVNFRKKLQEFVSTAKAAEVNVDIITTIDHNPADGIVRIARETMSDLVILGWPGKAGLWDKLLGDKNRNGHKVSG